MNLGEQFNNALKVHGIYAKMVGVTKEKMGGMLFSKISNDEEVFYLPITELIQFRVNSKEEDSISSIVDYVMKHIK